MYKTKKNQSENEHCENLSDEGSAQEVEFHRDTSLFEEDRKEFLKRMRLVKSSKPTFNYRQVQETSKLTTGRTFWSIEETDELVKTWLMLENDFFRNKRNASVWERLVKILEKRYGRRRAIRECRIKWKNMWAKHRVSNIYG
ncbi:hypothetical protein AX774_g6192 [Zancudomyces culisetae]|uniref:Myb-like domain-containing protein n=1 Tax=Zancudomyces culisetae TaxID=1213189 RepID=A0A1R1PHC7_ZANCU|nr:hypothetical protein AX774_g6192 [Zancudomyces culisetae]|eukprot:OMH80380.1 hypothetical protein AX774_g6192 [Zancudomyces culisetae]